MAGKIQNRYAAIVKTPANPELGFVDVEDARQRAYLIDYANNGGVENASRVAGVSREAIWKWRKADPQFEEKELSAKSMFAERLEREALRRAVEGIDKGVWYKGKRIGSEIEYSDSLLAALLKANIPDKFNDMIKVGGSENPIKVMALGLNLDSEETHDIIDKILLSAYRQATTEISHVATRGKSSGNGEGCVG
jgi:hypothetical protein